MGDPSPSRVRHLVVAACAAAAVVLYLDRVCLSIVGEYVRQDLGLTPAQLDWVFSAFFLTYALGQVPAGWLADRFGPRRAMTAYLLACGACMAGIAASSTFALVLAFRLLLGLAEAGGYPAASATVRRWVPAGARGRASSAVTLGGRVGGALTQVTTALLVVLFVPVTAPSLFGPGEVTDPAGFVKTLRSAPPGRDTVAGRVLVRVRAADAADPERLRAAVNDALTDPSLLLEVPLDPARLPAEARRIWAKPPGERTAAEVSRLHRLAVEAEFPGTVRQVYAGGWRWAFLTYAALGVAVAALFWAVARDRPADHPWCNAAEAALVEPPPAGPPAGRSVLRRLAASRTLWLSSASQFFLNFGWAFLITKLPSFLEDRYGVPVEERGVMAMVPLLAGAAGMVVGGWLADRLARTATPRWSRAAVLGLVPFVGAAAFVWLPAMPAAWAATAGFTLVAFAADVMTPSTWSLMQDVTRRHVGTALGWGNMWGNLGAFAAPVTLGAVRGGWGWDEVFYCCAGAFALSGLAGLFIDAGRGIDGD